MYQIANSGRIFVSQQYGDNKYCNGLAPVADQAGNGPVKTLGHALWMVNYMRQAGNDRPMTVYLMDDFYIPYAPLEIPNGVTITSWGSRKRVVGGIKVEGWKKDQFNGVDCFSAKLPSREGGWHFTDFFVNGKRADITRYPEEGTLHVVATEEGRKGGHFAASHVSGSSKWVELKKEDVAGLDRMEDAIFNFYHYWVDEHTPVESYDPVTCRLTMAYRSRFSCTASYEENDHGAVYYYLTNIPNAFCKPNHWYLDREQEVVYYIPEDINADPAELEAWAPVHSQLFRINGDDVHFKNLEIACSKGDYASMVALDEKLDFVFDSDIPHGSDLQAMCWAPGAIAYKNAARCSIENCWIHGLGVHAIEIGKGCNNIYICNNRIDDICASAVKVDGADAAGDAALAARDCRINGNHIFNCGVRYESSCGIVVINGNNIEIADNEVHDMKYSGISVGFEWGFVPSATYGNRIMNNHVYNIGGPLSDLGGIYLLGPQKGTFVTGNRIHNVRRSVYTGVGIYLDEGSSCVTVSDNVIYDIQDECIFLNYGANNVVRNNILFATGNSCFRKPRQELYESVLVEGNIMITDGSSVYGECSEHILTQTGRNLVWDVSGKSPKMCPGRDWDLQKWQELTHLDAGSVAVDPKIPGLSEFDFTLAEDSPAFEMGFQPLPEKTVKA